MSHIEIKDIVIIIIFCVFVIIEAIHRHKMEKRHAEHVKKIIESKDPSRVEPLEPWECDRD